jgi:crotonobetaine/carnitine-CoA ligase
MTVAEQAMEEMDQMLAEFEKRPRMTVVGALRRGVAAGGDFLQFDRATYTFADVDRLSTAFAHELRKLGIARGHTVAALLNNSIDQIVTWFAVNKLGGIWVPLNVAYRGEFLRHQLTDSAARVLVCEAASLDRALEVEDTAVDLELILCRGAIPSTVREARVPIAPLDDYRGEDDTPLEADPAPGDLSMLIYTSGTTGPSKGCMISHNFICHQAIQTNLAIPPVAGDVLYTCLPLFHVSAVDTVLSGLLTGTKVYVAEMFSASKFWHQIQESGATKARLMSSIFPIVADGPDTPEMKACYGQLRAVEGSPIPAEVRRKWHERFGVQFLNSFTYGLSEGVRLSMSRIGEDIPESSVGRIDDTAFQVAILDDEDNQVAEGHVGEIAFRPKLPNVMFEGYWRRPEETVKVWRNLWMHTGDMGRINDGFLYFTDRKKDYVRSRGENISSYEVENAVISHPEVLEVAAHAADAGRGEDCLKLTVVLAPGTTLTEEELCRWCVDNLPYFAVPRYIEFRQELPKTPTSKVQKNVLREQGVTSRTWERDPAKSRRR